MVLGGRSDANLAFSDLLNLLHALGFSQRISGSHHIIWKEGVIEIMNLQPRGQKAKPYQVRQVRNILVKYGLGANDDQPL
jgi:hypothetical protein